jgi:hypothetical protein
LGGTSNLTGNPVSGDALIPTIQVTPHSPNANRILGELLSAQKYVFNGDSCPTYLGSLLMIMITLEPVLRPKNLQLQRQRCSPFARAFFKKRRIKYF